MTPVRKTSSTSAGSRRKPARVHLLYGNKEAEINEAKLGIARELIPDDEERRENVVEIAPPVNYPLTLKAAYPQIMTELGQESLFGDSRRLVVVHQLQELFGAWGGGRRKASAAKAPKGKTKSAKSAKASDEEILDNFLGSIRRLVEATPNALMFVAVEDEAKNRRVNDKSPLFEGLASMGQARNFSAKSYRFELSDAVVDRSLSSAMRVVTQWRREDRRAANPIFRTLLDDVHLLVQASIHQRESARLSREPEYVQVLFPSDLRPNLQTIHDFRKRKYLMGVHNYPAVQDLVDALRGLLDIQKTLYPTGDELYVADVDYLIDVWLARLLGR